MEGGRWERQILGPLYNPLSAVSHISQTHHIPLNHPFSRVYVHVTKQVGRAATRRHLVVIVLPCEVG